MELSSDLRSIQETRSLLLRAKEAQKIYKEFSQVDVDRIVSKMAERGYEAREKLAKLAVEETGFGRVEHKVLKNIVGTKRLHDYIKDMKTCGIIRKTHNEKIWEVATPMGVVAALIPTTNPTSTMMYKAIIALKSRNAIVASPHPRSIRCTLEAAQIMSQAAKEAGAPDGLVNCISLPTQEGTSELIRHEITSVILATGGSAMVRAAYSSGKPAYGVGPGNVPAFIERTANVAKAVADILFGKTFDNGTLCSSEQSIVCDLPIKSKVIAELKKRGAYFVSNEERERLERYMFPKGLNPEVVGKPATFIAERAGIAVPSETTVLIAEIGGVGKKHPLSSEKLSPVLSFFTEDGWEAGCKRSIEILEFGGIGHSLAVHTENPMVIEQFALHKPAHRILINTVSAVGAVGYTTDLPPAMTLGPGTIGGSITTDNITPMHLLNIKRVAFETHPVNDTNGNFIPQDGESSSKKNESEPIVKRYDFAAKEGHSFMAEIEARIREKAGNKASPMMSGYKSSKPNGKQESKDLSKAKNDSMKSAVLSDAEINDLINQFKKK
ncbi:MAG: aldehyde dehydrogenase family protein [Chloroherpetonaceae bacterium]|nr:aldehyde dehydrogenase family protein [Chloroherpetonaceae bacterium]